MRPEDTVNPPPSTAGPANNVQYQQPSQWMSQHQPFQQPWMNHHQQQQQQQQWMNQQQAPQSFQYAPYQAMYYREQVPPHRTMQPQSLATQPTNNDERRELWVGRLPSWMDNKFLIAHFGSTGEVVSAKVIQNRTTGQSEGYGFIECVNHAAAERILRTYHGTPVPHTEMNFDLHWANYSTVFSRSSFTVFVGNLSHDVTEEMLIEMFRLHYPSIKGARVVMDPLTGRSKGCGFVRFADENEQLRAVSEMHGQWCSTKQIRVWAAVDEKDEGCQDALSF